MDLKWIAAAAIILIIVASAVYYGTANDGLTGFTLFSPIKPIKDISVKASLLEHDFVFDPVIAEILVINFEPQDREIMVGSQKVELSASTSIKITEFQGRISLKNGKISLGGSGESVSVQGVPISEINGRVNFGADDIIFTYLDIIEIIAPATEYKNADGYAYINDEKYYIKFTDEKFSLGPFEGDLSVKNTQMEFFGVTDYVKLEGETNILIEE